MEELVLKEPTYVKWLIKQTVSGPLLAMKNEANNLIQKFDDKPYKIKCCGQNCDKAATRLSVYQDNVSPYWWCDTCDPYEKGANNGKLKILRKYTDALLHIQFFCNDNKKDCKNLIKVMAQGKGLPLRVGEQQAQAFFS